MILVWCGHVFPAQRVFRGLSFFFRTLSLSDVILWVFLAPTSSECKGFLLRDRQIFILVRFLFFSFV